MGKVQHAKKEKEAVQKSGGAARKPHRYHPGTVALREIHKYQQDGNLLLRKLPFQRAVRELTHQLDYKVEHRFQAKGLLTLQSATEAYVTNLLSNGNLAAIHAKRVTLQPKDLQLSLRIENKPL